MRRRTSRFTEMTNSGTRRIQGKPTTKPAERDSSSDEADFLKRVTNQLKMCAEYAESATATPDLAEARWASEPIDHLSSVLQHLDSKPKAMLDTCYHSGPIHKAQKALYQMIVDNTDNTA